MILACSTYNNLPRNAYSSLWCLKHQVTNAVFSKEPWSHSKINRIYAVKYYLHISSFYEAQGQADCRNLWPQ